MDWRTWRLVVEGYRLAGCPYGPAADLEAVLRWWHEHLKAMLGDAHPIPGAKNRKQAIDNAGALSFSLSPDEVAALDQATLAWRVAGSR